MKNSILILTLFNLFLYDVSFIHGVHLNREILSDWYPQFNDTPIIELFYKDITSIDSNTFACMPNLVKLYLDENLITSINATTFSELINLEYLFLSFNQLSYIDSKAFVNLKKLRELYLDQNLLAYI